MEKAVEQENFQAAAKCKVALDAVTEKDVVAEVMNGLKVNLPYLYLIQFLFEIWSCLLSGAGLPRKV